jgi:hypothetical protein
MTYTDEQITALADAMWQLLDDMGKNGLSVCLAAKAEARRAYEPFITLEDSEICEDLMSMAEAEEIGRQT